MSSLANQTSENSSLVNIASALLQSTTTFQDLLQHHELPFPSLAADGRKDWIDTQPFPEIVAARSRLIDQARALLDLALGPTDILGAYSGGTITEIEVLRTIVELEIYDAVPLDGEIDMKELAKKLGIKNEVGFRDQMKFAFLMGLFRETKEGKVTHSVLSAALPGSSGWVKLRLGKLYTQGGHEVANFLRTEDGTGGIYAAPGALADPTGQRRSTWEQLHAANLMELYSPAMPGLLAHHSGGAKGSLIEGFDWESLGQGATVVDVGGGNGHIDVAAAPRHPGIHFIVQDQASNEDGAKQLIADSGVSGQVEFQVHNFFEPQPTLPGGRVPKAYMLMRVLQDWSAADCVRILKPLANEMKGSGARLWILGRILPDEPGTMPIYQEKLLRNMGLLCFMLYGAGERTASDLRKILQATDSKLKITKIVRPPHSVLSFAEIVWG